MVNWIGGSSDLRFAGYLSGAGDAFHLAVERLGEGEWDWHVWKASGFVCHGYGTADTLDDAMKKAESALKDFLEQLSQAA